MKASMKVWITKYALTSGITEHNAELCDGDELMKYGTMQYAYGDGKEWHRSYKSALIRAEEMRIKKIASLKKSIAMLEAMSFEV